jgi:hypothetical protein
MESLKQLLHFLFVYCTDFMINLANLLGLSYYEVNFWVFVVGYSVGVIFLAIVLLIHLKNAKSQ